MMPKPPNQTTRGNLIRDKGFWRLPPVGTFGCGCQNRFGIPFWLVGEFTTHFRLPILVVGLGCSLKLRAFEPWPCFPWKSRQENRPVCCIEVDLEPMTDEGVQLESWRIQEIRNRIYDKLHPPAHAEIGLEFLGTCAG